MYTIWSAKNANRILREFNDVGAAIQKALEMSKANPHHGYHVERDGREDRTACVCYRGIAYTLGQWKDLRVPDQYEIKTIRHDENLINMTTYP